MGLFDFNPNQLGLAAGLFGAGQGGTYPINQPPPNQWNQMGRALMGYAQAQKEQQLFDMKKQQFEAEMKQREAKEQRRTATLKAWESFFGQQPTAGQPAGGVVPMPGMPGASRPSPVMPEANVAPMPNAVLPGSVGVAPMPGMPGASRPAPVMPGGAPRGAPGSRLTPELRAFLRAVGPEKGAPIYGNILTKDPKERRIVKGPGGIPRFVDTGDPVFSGIGKPSDLFTIEKGDETITYSGLESDPTSWNEVSRSPRYKPHGGGFTLSPGQTRFGPGGVPVANASPAERRIVKGADGFSYYSDTGERVLPGVEQAPDAAATVSYGNPVPFENDKGQFIGMATLNNRSGKYELQVPGATGRNPLPAGSRPRTTAQLGNPPGALKGPQFGKLHDEVVADAISIKQLKDYGKRVGSTQQGYKLWADQFAAAAKTFLGDDVSDRELQTMIQDGQLSGLTGKFRNEIAGPGMMSDQDANRIIEALGGRASAFRNPGVVANAIERVMGEKIQGYNAKVQRYNASRAMVPEYSRLYPEINPIEVDVNMGVWDQQSPPIKGQTYFDSDENVEYEFMGGDASDKNSWRRR